MTTSSGVTPTRQIVSLRAFARHLGVSVEAVRRGIRAERIQKALRTDANGRQCIELAAGEAEWRENLTGHQLRSRPELAEPKAEAAVVDLADEFGPPPAAVFDLVVSQERFSVTSFSVVKDGPLVLLAVFPAASTERAVDATIFPMLPETARVLAAALTRIARERSTSGAGGRPK